jgi:hypothetical protein
MVTAGNSADFSVGLFCFLFFLCTHKLVKGQHNQYHLDFLRSNVSAAVRASWQLTLQDNLYITDNLKT